MVQGADIYFFHIELYKVSIDFAQIIFYIVILNHITGNV